MMMITARAASTSTTTTTAMAVVVAVLAGLGTTVVVGGVVAGVGEGTGISMEEGGSEMTTGAAWRSGNYVIVHGGRITTILHTMCVIYSLICSASNGLLFPVSICPASETDDSGALLLLI